MYSSSRLPAGNGLGFPFVPLIGVGVSAAAGLFKRGGGNKKEKVSREDARQFVRQQYIEVFGRDPVLQNDPGMDGFVNCLVEGWCDGDFVRSELLKSPEYADKWSRGLLPSQRSGAVAGTLPPGLSTTTTAAGAAPFGGELAGGFGGGGFDVMRYLPYAIGAIVLVSVLKK